MATDQCSCACSNGNLALWNELSKVDPRRTKEFRKGGGFRGTDINPVWRMQRMTELFGPVGQGWGYEIHSQWREDFGSTPVVFVKLDLWYCAGLDEEGVKIIVWTGPQIGGTEATRTPDEAYKMAVTDAMGKCMLNLGLAAPVYLGDFNDTKYQQAMLAEFEEKEAENAWQHKPNMKAIQDWLDACTTLDEVDSTSDKVRALRPPKSARPEIKALFDARRAELNGGKP